MVEIRGFFVTVRLDLLPGGDMIAKGPIWYILGGIAVDKWIATRYDPLEILHVSRQFEGKKTPMWRCSDVWFADRVKMEMERPNPPIPVLFIIDTGDGILRKYEDTMLPSEYTLRLAS